MEAGDLLIFNSIELHGIRVNKSGNKVRMAQYISMMPAEEDNEPLRQWRIFSWRERRAQKDMHFLVIQENGNKQNTIRQNFLLWAGNF
jgi:ectoine hydroxylase-related dioxygenase (phytanoyl-CoA dioxygenase family)